MSQLTYETAAVPDSQPDSLLIDAWELDTQYEVTQAIGEIEALLHGTYAARRWGVTDQLPGGTRDLDMFGMRLPDGSGIEEVVARSETRSVHEKPLDRMYAVDIFLDGSVVQQLRMDESGRLEAFERHDMAAPGSAGGMVELDEDGALSALYEFRHRMSIARDRVDKRTADERTEADADALKKLRRQVYGADFTTTSID